MDEPKRELVKNWFVKAQHDLDAAKQLSSVEQPLLDVAIYHCQQAAEKAVKSFLVFHDQEFEKTHDIEDLLSSAIRFDNRLETFFDSGETLTPYASLYRYPGTVMEPEKEEFDEALKAAENVLNFILRLFPENYLTKELL